MRHAPIALALLTLTGGAWAQGAGRPERTQGQSGSGLEAEVARLKRELAEARRQIEDLRRTGAKAPEETGFISVELVGTVQAVSPERVDVLDGEGNVYELKVDPGTKALKGGRQISIQELPQGAAVRSSFEWVRGQGVARELELLEKPAPDAGRMKESKV